MNIFVWKWSKIAAQKKFFLLLICLGPPSYGIGATIRIGREMLCLPYAGFFLYKSASYSLFRHKYLFDTYTYTLDFSNRPYICLTFLVSSATHHHYSVLSEGFLSKPYRYSSSQKELLAQHRKTRCMYAVSSEASSVASDKTDDSGICLPSPTVQTTFTSGWLWQPSAKF